MSATPKRVRLEGSTKEKARNGEVVGAPPAQEFEVTVMVRRKKKLPAPETYAEIKPSGRRRVSRAEHAAEFGADPADIAKVEAFARESGLRVVRSDAALRSVVLAGT